MNLSSLELTQETSEQIIEPAYASMDTEPHPALDEVDAARTLLYRLLAHALTAPPDAALLDRIARLRGDDGPLGTALAQLAQAAAAITPEAARREYDKLFIGVARGELLPYASFYQTGFLHERPLARLRGELQRLGLARAAGQSDPEDHIATICDVMATLIARHDAELEAGFFARHLAPWAAAFFTDLERTAARLYPPVGRLGRLLIELDRQGFAYAADTSQRGAA